MTKMCKENFFKVPGNANLKMCPLDSLTSNNMLFYDQHILKLPDVVKLKTAIIMFNLLGTKFLGNCMCYHGRVIIEGCRTKCVIDKYTNIFIF